MNVDKDIQNRQCTRRHMQRKHMHALCRGCGLRRSAMHLQRVQQARTTHFCGGTTRRRAFTDKTVMKGTMNEDEDDKEAFLSCDDIKGCWCFPVNTWKHLEHTTCGTQRTAPPPLLHCYRWGWGAWSHPKKVSQANKSMAYFWGEKLAPKVCHTLEMAYFLLACGQKIQKCTHVTQKFSKFRELFLRIDWA